MAANAVETVDRTALDALREGVAGVLVEQSGSTAIHAFIDGKRALDRELWQQAAVLGWLAVGIPERHGGLGLGARGLAILHGELGRQATPGPYIATLAAAETIAACGDEAGQQRYLPRIAGGEISAAVPADLSRATASGALRCLGAPDAALLVAQTAEGWALFELASAEVSEVPIWDRTRTVIEVKLGTAKPAATLDRRAGDTLLRAMTLAIAADSAGAARSITERTIAYMKTREQFGQPIAGFQALKHRAADLVTKLAVMDELVAHAVERIEAGEPDADLWAMLAKAESTEAFAFIATDCTQLHGGVGFTWDFDPHIFLKRARLNEALATPNPALRDRAAAIMAEMARAERTALELAL